MEIRRFGVGNRRPDGPAGTTGVASQVIHADARGVGAELAFARRATMDLHSSPNSAWLVIVEGGGWVQVGDERARVAAGTELSEMRAFRVEFAGADDAAARGILEGRAPELNAGGGARVAPAPTGEGSLASGVASNARTAAEGEPV